MVTYIYHKLKSGDGLMDKNKNWAPCFIKEGTIYHKKDMLRALETLENVEYKYIVDKQVVQEGQGAILKVFASRHSATLIINNCVFINVLSFDFLDFYSAANGSAVVELKSDASTLLLNAIDEEIKVPRSDREILASVDQFDDEETFALLEEGEGDEED